jgi:hypothetical protein
MTVGSTPRPGDRPVYIYNGISDLKELKEVNLNGASLFFNGSFRVEDLRGVDLVGANVFFNGQVHVRRFTSISGTC